MGVSQPYHHLPPLLTFAVLLCDLLKLFSPDVKLEVLIKPIPSMLVTMAMPVVLSPKMLPFIIRRAPVKHRDTPMTNRVRCHVLVLVFKFCASLFISNLMLDIYNSMLDIYNISVFKLCCAKTRETSQVWGDGVFAGDKVESGIHAQRYERPNITNITCKDPNLNLTQPRTGTKRLISHRTFSTLSARSMSPICCCCPSPQCWFGSVH